MTSFFMNQRVRSQIRVSRRRSNMHKRRNAMRAMESSFKRLKSEMEEISEEQRSIREGQRQVREKFETIVTECQTLKRETQLVLEHSARNKIRLVLMFKILKAREEGDFDKATELARILRELITRENIASSNEK